MKINFRNSDYAPGDETPGVKRIKAYLESLPEGDVIGTRDLSRVWKSITRESSNPIFKDFRHQIGTKLWWGTPATIKALRKQVQ